MSQIAALVKKAERSARFGVEHIESIYAEGCAQLDPRDLGCLVLHLRRLNEKWNPSRAERNRLALALIAAGSSDGEVQRLAGISRMTCWRLRTSENPQDPSKRGPEPAFQSGDSVSNRAHAGNGSQLPFGDSAAPILHFDATSGANW